MVLLTPSSPFPQVAEVYEQVHQSMIQTPIKDNVPLFWSTMSQIKTNHYRSMAHFFVASALLDHQRKRTPQRLKSEVRKNRQVCVARVAGGLRRAQTSC